MKYYTFKRESDNFDDILKDPTIKKFTKEKLKWRNHLMIGLDTYDKDFDKNCVYLTLKHSDDIVTNLTKDYKPIANVDYTPIRK